LRNFLANAQANGQLLEHVPAAFAVFDTEMRFLACSRRWRVDYRIGDKDLSGRSYYEVFPETEGRWSEIHRRAIGGETLSGEADPIVRADGSIERLRWKIAPLPESDGRIGGVVLFTQMLPGAVETMETERALRAEFELLVEGAKDYAVTMTDLDGKVTHWNAGAERLYGWETSEILGRSLEVVMTPEDCEAGVLADQLALALRAGPNHKRYWRTRKDDTRFMVDAVLSVIRDSDGTARGFGEVVRDVTEAMEQRRAIEEGENYLRSILDTIPDAMITIDAHGSIQSFSAAAERLFGYAACEVMGRNVSMLMPEPDASKHDDYLAHYRSTGEPRIIGRTRRVYGRRKDGSLFPHELYVGEVENGGSRTFIGFLRDLTEREDADARLRELQDELVRISRISAVGTMATALAHELNQPLAAIVNYVQSSAALLARQKTETLNVVGEALEEAGREALRAGAIVQRLRDFVASGDLDRSYAAPYDLAAQARDLGAVGSKAREITCEILIPRDLPPVLVDRVQIQQVLINMIRNAIDAVGKNGAISIVATREGDHIRFGVIDDGPGVDPDKQAELFEPFFSTKSSGMGMGLAISRTIVEAHGGQMWCESTPESGAAFYFTIPVTETGDD
jgi:two-component system sensor kinase FixL